MTRPDARGSRAMRRAVIAGAVVAGVALIGAGVFASLRGADDPPPLPNAVHPLLPDLVMSPIEDISATRNEVGAKRLRFAATIVNIGDGDFVVRADRPLPMSRDWSVAQLIPEQAGGHTEQRSGATLVYGGDGHNHYHIEGVERHRLETMDGTVLGEVVKQGFCFFDTDLLQPARPDVSAAAVYKAASCGGEYALRSRMGLSVGWGDKYPWNMLEQNIDITDVPDGEYRIREVADPFGYFVESDVTNNEVWADIRLTTEDGVPKVTVIARSDSVLPLRSAPPTP